MAKTSGIASVPNPSNNHSSKCLGGEAGSLRDLYKDYSSSSVTLDLATNLISFPWSPFPMLTQVTLHYKLPSVIKLNSRDEFIAVHVNRFQDVFNPQSSHIILCVAFDVWVNFGSIQRHTIIFV